MQLQKDVLIAGGVVVVCVALVIVALVATGKKDQPTDSSTGTGTSYADSTYGSSGGSSYGSYGSSGLDAGTGTGSTSSGMGSDPFGSTSSGSAFGSTSSTGSNGGSAFGSSGAGLGANDPYGAFAPTGTTGTTGATGTTGSTGAADPFATGTGMGTASTGASTATSAAAEPTSKGGTTHTVAKGETLGDISATHYGTTKHWRKIVEANPGLDPARLKIGQEIQIPVVESAAPAAAAAAGGADTYTVAKGDSYYTIAKKKLGSSSRWREIERLNNVPAEELRVGMVIKLPAAEQSAGGTGGAAGVGGGKTHVVSKGETLGDISKQYFGTTTKWKAIVEANPGVRPENLKVGQSLAIPDLPAAAAVASGPAAPAGGSTYTVKAGDTLETIAAATLGKKTAWKQIVEANPGLKPTALRIGQVIAIPGVSAAATAAPAAGDAFGAPTTPGAAPAAPAAPPQPTYLDDPFYSPYDTAPAAPAGGARPAGGVSL